MFYAITESVDGKVVGTLVYKIRESTVAGMEAVIVTVPGGWADGEFEIACVTDEDVKLCIRFLTGLLLQRTSN